MPGRRHDWEQRLVAYLAAAEGKPYQYGKHDCMLFIGGAIKAVNGRDLARGHRGKYSTAAGAIRYLKKIGFGSFADMVNAYLDEKPVSKAMRGDIVTDQDGIPGVVIGGDAVFVGEINDRPGLIRKPRSLWQRAWSA